MDIIPKQIPIIQSLAPKWYEPFVSKMDMLRLDVVHPVVSGNKWYKLKRNIQHALDNGHTTILTFGGGYSNHLVATAVAAKAYGFHAIGIVRGVYPELTPTLKSCMEYGMQLEFVTKEEYTLKEDAEFLSQLSAKYSRAFIIPEGGANEWGREGAEEIASYVPAIYTHVCMSVGTGTTLAGIRNALPAEQHVWGYVPMKKGSYILEEIQPWLHNGGEVKLFDGWHFGGFGKWNDELLSFMNGFYKTNNIPLDIVYTSKMMYGIQQQLKVQVFRKDAIVLCIHTGGLQGNASVQPFLTFTKT